MTSIGIQWRLPPPQQSECTVLAIAAAALEQLPAAQPQQATLRASAIAEAFPQALRNDRASERPFANLGALIEEARVMVLTGPN